MILGKLASKTKVINPNFRHKTLHSSWLKIPSINIAILETHKDPSTSSLYSNQKSLAHVELENNKNRYGNQS